MEWHNVLEAVMCNLTKTQSLKEEFKREDELMSHLWSNQSTRRLMSLWLMQCHNKRESKSTAKAQTFKIMGNKQFQSKNYCESIQSYTKSALYAPANSCELSIAIANRSAALFYLDRHSDCIKDTELALKFNYPKELRYKLHFRALQCYLKLGKPDLAREMLSKICTLINNPDYVAPSMKGDIEKRISEITFNKSCIKNETKSIDSLLELKSKLMFDENPDFPCASTGIVRKYNEELGRHVIANRFIKKGEILFLEKPVSFVLLNHNTVDHLCQHCNCSNTDIPLPCTGCLNTFYCTANCSNEAWSSYHCWECPGNQMDLWKEIGIGHLALKVFLTCTTTMDRIKFNEMQNLVTNFNKLSMDDLTVYGITAIMLTVYLLEYTNFFEKSDLNDCLARKFCDNTFNSNFNIVTDDDKQLYVSSLLLRYILQLICNGHAVSKSDTLLSKSDSSVDQQDIVATGIYPSASMMNHSCDPNIINIFMDQYLIVRASKDIATDEEVFNCYGPHYRHMSREQRQKVLMSQYCFICRCEPCIQPNLQHFLKRFNAMSCLKCNGALCNISNTLCCLDCGDQPRNCQMNKIKQAETLFQTAQTCIDLGKMEEALNKLKKCLHIRKAILYKYNEDITFTLNLMEEIYTARGRFVDSIECIESIIDAVTEKFGYSSTEFLNVLNKLTDLCAKYLQNESNTTTDTYKTILRKTYKYLDQVEELVDFNYGSWSKVCENIKKKHHKIASIT
ncbi:PREDICTED: SET and MYND domain-containing protein 4 [Dufourea novaeangliae]|uniref:Protein-lysine N-methyltransferase SMYD4 n=1 Tax=Dufourea novaeangliae TaxID=178035 RepID=A0A154P9Z0_DUFNO|nr:PREDICTED: SET and MYND domain-containing protein 4 [Dufourea novaeangliae]KZC08204.1 SET and MYND domain-containing protein 4 [Dufourea novaeangliae]